jgi:ubiquinone/menaquinone biosynthesis C-methylase UbiE
MSEYFMALTKLNINEQAPHALLPKGTHDERARQNFMKSLHHRSSSWSRAEAGRIWTGRVLPAFQKQHGRKPETRKEVRLAMEQDPFWQTVVGMRRISQEMLWNACIDSVENELDTLMAHAKEVDRGLGSLTVDPDLEIPKYISAVDIHVMPGNYHTEYTANDISQGAVYERGSYLYTHGYNGPRFDNLGQGVLEYIQKTFPDFKPKRILDMGAAIGNSTLPYCDAFPDAEVYAIDIGAPLVRYGYARANALGKAVHFSQQNAESTSFPDGYFDLVVSHIMFHETSREAIPKIFAESKRLLAPGGKMVHADLPDISRIPDLFQQVSVNQDHYDNNEPMWGSYHSLDLKKCMQEAGFASDTIRLEMSPMVVSVPPDHNNPDTSKTVRGQFGYGVFAAEA